MQVITTTNICSNFSKQKSSLAHTKERFDGFIMYAPAGAVCQVIAEHGDVLILEHNNNRFPAHKNKTARI